MRDAYDEAMAGVLDRIACEGREEELFGGKLDHALEIFHRFSTQTAKPVGLIEIPLLGAPGFDVGIGSYRGQLEPGTLLYDQSQPTAQAAFDWLTAWSGEP